MILAGKTVRFWLSQAARQELPGALSSPESFEALVVEEDPLGVWIWVASEQSESTPEVTLLKWEQFCTARAAYEAPPEMQDRAVAGFRP